MLGWTGGAKGVAVQIPSDVEVGSAPPASKPRPSGGEGGKEGEVDGGGKVEGLFEKKLTKAEKKKVAEERRKAKKSAKLAKETEE